MPNLEARKRYDAVAQSFHWILAALIVTQFALAWSANDLPLGMRKLALLARHKGFLGIAILWIGYSVAGATFRLIDAV